MGCPWNEDGTFLHPVYAIDLRGDSHNYVWRSADSGSTWRLYPMGSQVFALECNETGMVEVSPGCILAHTRNDHRPLVERWSYDGGVTWTDPLSTGVHGWPAHLLKLHDGRILCAYGRRMEPGGVRAVLSEDGGQTWDLDNEVVLRDDAGYASSLKGGFGWRADVGYPVSVQLPDDSILTAYYITESDRITHTAVTRWEV